ncbi:helix-turn-helix transcriptional regulator [Ensifer sp. ENS07]|uniref:helix-turn-helix domain-containing protein n=1 Tax=Ensifer sp. ENS07 TaxID=2769274 RepID=UPI001781710F|nr:helix-turn-helix transcriptional regulator [Ensifer sp. ENS07]MBD9636002.1 helix-turn-helix transcriptional regulator [Ensifer sp. ENS07]
MRREPTEAEQFQSMLEALRTEHGMTPAEISRETGVSRQTLWRLENGEARKVSYAVGHAVERLYRDKRR